MDCDNSRQGGMTQCSLLIRQPFRFLNNARSILKLEMRSASRSTQQQLSSRNQLYIHGNIFSSIVLFAPPLNLLFGQIVSDHIFAPLNTICSKWERPVMPLIFVAVPYFVKQIHISVWDREVSTTNTYLFLRVKVFTSSAFILCFPVRRAKKE
jgi:hypothetical protein